MDTKSSLLESSSKISSLIQCDNCLLHLDQVRWKQCMVCNNFDLCSTCEKDGASQKDRTLDRHKERHKNGNHSDPDYDTDMDFALIAEVETNRHDDLIKFREQCFTYIMDEKKIHHDHDMSYIMHKLEKASEEKCEELKQSELGSMLLDYHKEAYEHPIRVLSLDGGGVRGFMTIKVLEQFIEDTYVPPSNSSGIESQENVEKQRQEQFTDQFDYFAGTSTGGLIAFCLAAKYPLSKIRTIYSDPKKYFIRNWFTRWYTLGVGRILWAQYNDQKIHQEIDNVIKKVFEESKLDGHKELTAKNATLHDLRKLLNPDQTLGREKVLLINAYNTTDSKITVFNTSSDRHKNYLIADVLKATMAAPTYFKPHTISIGTEDRKSKVFIDGGVFANDPELTALWAIRMHLDKLVYYRFLSIGTGCYNSELHANTWGGYSAWLMNWSVPGLVINTLMDATRSLTEIIMTDLAKYDNIKRMKFNYKLTRSLALDDAEFPNIFDEEWDKSNDLSETKLTEVLKDGSKGLSTDKWKYGLKYGSDYKALIYFYRTYINDANQ